MLSTDKPATASSEETDRGNVAENANDSKPTTRWAPDRGEVPSWWKVDLQDIYDLTGAEIDWYKDDAYYQYKIEVSTDDQNWTELVDETDNTTREATTRHDFEEEAR